MRINALSITKRAISSLAIVAILATAPLGCDDSGTKAGDPIPEGPAAKQANKNMEDFVKTKKEAKKS